MLSGKEKSLVLLSVLGPQSKAILAKLAPASAEILMAGIEDTPRPSNDVLRRLATELRGRLDQSSDAGVEAPPVGQDVVAPESFSSDSGWGAPLEESESLDDLEALEAIEPFLDYSEIAQALSEERKSVLVFFVNRLPKLDRTQVLEYLSEDLRSEVEKSKADPVPMGDTVYDMLYKKYFHRNAE